MPKKRRSAGRIVYYTEAFLGGFLNGFGSNGILFNSHTQYIVYVFYIKSDLQGMYNPPIRAAFPPAVVNIGQWVHETI